MNNQNDRVLANGRKSDVAAKRLLVECEKFAMDVMVSADVCSGGKGKLHFIAEKPKVSAKYYVENRLLHLVNDCKKNSFRIT